MAKKSEKAHQDLRQRNVSIVDIGNKKIINTQPSGDKPVGK